MAIGDLGDVLLGGAPGPHGRLAGDDLEIPGEVLDPVAGDGRIEEDGGLKGECIAWGWSCEEW